MPAFIPINSNENCNPNINSPYIITILAEALGGFIKNNAGTLARKNRIAHKNKGGISDTPNFIKMKLQPQTTTTNKAKAICFNDIIYIPF
jgi:hypothetical protein